MGSLSMMHARNRFRKALQRKLEKCENGEEKISVYEEAVTVLLQIAGIDSIDIDRTTWDYADDPEKIFDNTIYTTFIEEMNAREQQ